MEDARAETDLPPADDPLDLLWAAAKSEATRLAARHRLGLLDTPQDPAFDAIVEEAARRFGTPVALISLLDAKRLWFKARVGLDVSEAPRDVAFCRYTIQGDSVLRVADATQDPRFADNPFVTGYPGIRFYAGAPVQAPDGSRIGTLCLIDMAPRASWTAEENATLLAMAAAVSAEMARRAPGADGGPPAPARPA